MLSFREPLNVHTVGSRLQPEPLAFLARYEEGAWAVGTNFDGEQC